MPNLTKVNGRDNDHWREVMALATGSRPYLLLSDRQRHVLQRALDIAQTALAIDDLELAIDAFYAGICDLTEPTSSGSRR